MSHRKDIPPRPYRCHASPHVLKIAYYSYPLSQVLEEVDLADANRKRKVMSANFFKDIFDTFCEFNKTTGGVRALARSESNTDKETGVYQCRNQVRNAHPWYTHTVAFVKPSVARGDLSY